METRGFFPKAHELLRTLALQEVAVDPAMKKIENDRGISEVCIYRNDKFEKIVFSEIRLHETGVDESSLIMWPRDGYALPVLWCNLTIVPGVMNVPIFDFIPMLDIVVWPEYAARYMPGLSDLRDSALETFGDTIINKAVDLPSLVAYALSPYRLIINVQEDGVQKMPEVVEVYLRAYLKHVQEATALTSDEQKEFSRRRKESCRKLMKGNDPGYPFMLDVFGEKNTQCIFDLVF